MGDEQTIVSGNGGEMGESIDLTTTNQTVRATFTWLYYIWLT